MCQKFQSHYYFKARSIRFSLTRIIIVSLNYSRGIDLFNAADKFVIVGWNIESKLYHNSQVIHQALTRNTFAPTCQDAHVASCSPTATQYKLGQCIHSQFSFCWSKGHQRRRRLHFFKAGFWGWKSYRWYWKAPWYLSPCLTYLRSRNSACIRYAPDRSEFSWSIAIDNHGQKVFVLLHLAFDFNLPSLSNGYKVKL